MMKYMLWLTVILSWAHTPLFGADSTRTFLLISDTQQPIWIETLRLRSTDNEAATAKLYSAIAHHPNAEAVFHLGDVTAIGMFDAYWHAFDAFQRSLRIPLHPLLGNHDYYALPLFSMRQFMRRFPDFSPTWYATTIGSVTVIALNSNFSYLSDDDRYAQRSWYRQTLSAVNADTAVHAVIVLCHHSPFTNSEIVDPSSDVRSEFVAPFLAEKKCRVFISGHAHTYEHFQEQGKDFLVIGGGGGLLHPLKTGAAQVFPDLFPEATSMRFFHYLECTVTPDVARFTVRRLTNDQSGFESVDPFTVRFAP